MIPVNQLGDDIAPAVMGINVTPPRRRKGRQIQGSLKSVRLVNKKDTLELLGRHLGLFKDHLVIEHGEFEGKTPEELRHYAEHGKWPARSADNARGDGGAATQGEGQEVSG